MEKQGIRRDLVNWKVSVGVLLLAHLFFLNSLKFTAWPEMLLWPHLMLKGWLPYQDIAIAHNPALLLDLSIFNWLFGIGLWQLKAYTWTTILMLDGFLYWIAKKIWDNKTALYALAFFIPLQLFYGGNGLWFDLSLGLIALITYYFLRKKDYFKVGVFWALAFLVKQTAFWFLIPIAISSLRGESLQGVKKKLRRFAFGVLILFLPTVLIIWFLGILPDYFFWAYEFGVGILPKASGQVSLPSFRQLLIAFLPFSVFLFFLARKKKEAFGLSMWAVAGFMGAFPRWGLFHFQPAIPFLATALALVALKANTLKPFVRYLFVVYLVFVIAVVSRFLVRDFREESRFLEPEILKVVNYLKSETHKGDKIYVLNAWDSVYALSDTLPAVAPWIPHLSWYMELPGVQKGIVNDLEKQPPSLIVVGEYGEKGLSSYKPKVIDEFINQNYQEKGKIGRYFILNRKK